MLGVVVQIDGFDPVLAQPVTLRAASHDDAAVCHLAGGDPWWPALIKLPTLRYDLFDGAFGADITAPSSSLTMAAAPWPNLGRYALADARLQLWTGDVGAPWGSWTLRFDGRVSEQPELADGTASIDFAVDDRWLDAALLDTYAGTSGPEGTEALKGQPKPLALGAPRYVGGTLVDNINNVLQLSAYGPLHGFEAGLERLARFGIPAGDFPSYAALVAANVPAGRWATARAVGMARLGAPPTGQISFLIAGDEGGPNGWARLPGQIIRRLALLSGGAGRINDASLNALDAARPYNLSVNVDQQTTARQLIQQIAASVNAVAGMSWTGQLFVVPVGIGAPGMTLAADGSALPPVASVKQIGIASPFQKLAIGAARAWTVHALSDIAFTATLVELGTYVDAATYREGNIVSLADGSRWLYINATAGAGHAPPDGTAGDAWWSNLSAPIAGSGTYPDGTPYEAVQPAEPGADKTSDHTSKDTAAVSGRPAADVVADLDFNADTMLETLLRYSTQQALIDFRTLINGKTYATVIQSVSDKADGYAAKLDLLATSVPGATALQINAGVTIAGDDRSVSSRIISTEVTLGNLSASVDNVIETLIDPTGATTRALFTMDVNGYVSGTLQTNNGKVSGFYVYADQFGVVSNVGGQPVKVFEIINGELYANSLIVGRLKVGTGGTTALPSIVSGSARIAAAGFGNWVQVLTTNVVMDGPGTITGQSSLKQDFQDGSQEWASRLLINGTVVFTVRGARFADSLSLLGSLYLPAAGTYAVTVQFYGGSGVSILDRTLVATPIYGAAS